MNLRYWAKRAAYGTPLRRFLAPRYIYNFEPSQLAVLVGLADSVAAVPGTFIEVGCFAGATTVYLNEHLRTRGQKRRYVAIDTFSGFVAADVAYEIAKRDKGAAATQFATGFQTNRREWVVDAVRVSGFSNVDVIQADASLVDYAMMGPIAFALVDVDLYQPVSRVLALLWPLMASGGVIVVDDCSPGHSYDGALAAYTEFCEQHSLPIDIRERKLGVLRAPHAGG